MSYNNYFIKILQGICIVGCIVFSTKVNAQKRDMYLIAGCAWDKIALLDRETQQIHWSHQLTSREDCNDVELTREGNILYAYSRGAKIIDWEHNVLFDFEVKKNEELYTATELKNGNLLLAMCGNPARIVEIEKTGEVINEQLFDTKITNIHSQFRQLEVNKDGSFWVPLMGKGIVIRLNQYGEISDTIRCGGNPFSAKHFDKNKLLIATGDGHRLVIYNTKSKLIEDEIKQDEIEGCKLLFVAETRETKDGHIVLTNWNGHSRDKTQSKMIEIDREGKMVWRLNETNNIRNISTCCPVRLKIKDIK